MVAPLHAVGFQSNPWLKQSLNSQHFSGRSLLPHPHVKSLFKPQGKHALKISSSSSSSSFAAAAADDDDDRNLWKSWTPESLASDKTVSTHYYKREDIRVNIHHHVLPLLGKCVLIVGLGLNSNMKAIASTCIQPTNITCENNLEEFKTSLKGTETAIDDANSSLFEVKTPMANDAISSSIEEKEMDTDMKRNAISSDVSKNANFEPKKNAALDASGNAQPSDVSKVRDFDVKRNKSSDAMGSTHLPNVRKNAISNPKKSASLDALKNDDVKSLERFRLSDGFWRGIPTPEGSYMYSLKQELSKHPGNFRILELLLRAVIKKQDMLRALTVLETLLEIQPNRLKWKFLKARTHEFLGDIQMAKMEYQELLDHEPLSAKFLQGFVMLLNKVGEGSQALNLIQGALERAQMEKKNIEARNLGMLLGQFYIQLGKFEHALQHLSRMIDEDPDDFRPYLCQGLVYTLMDQNDKAEEKFKKYMELCPPESLEKSDLDELMVDVKVNRMNDAVRMASLESSSKRKKKPKILQQPGMQRLEQENFD